MFLYFVLFCEVLRILCSENAVCSVVKSIKFRGISGTLSGRQRAVKTVILGRRRDDGTVAALIKKQSPHVLKLKKQNWNAFC